MTSSLPTGAGCIASVNLVTEAAAPRQCNVALWRQGHLERVARLSPSAGEKQVYCPRLPVHCARAFCAVFGHGAHAATCSRLLSALKPHPACWRALFRRRFARRSKQCPLRPGRGLGCYAMLEIRARSASSLGVGARARRPPSSHELPRRRPPRHSHICCCATAAREGARCISACPGTVWDCRVCRGQRVWWPTVEGSVPTLRRVPSLRTPRCVGVDSGEVKVF